MESSSQSRGRKIFNVVELFWLIRSGLKRNVEVPLCFSHQDSQVRFKALLPSPVSLRTRVLKQTRIYTRAALPPRVSHFSAELNV